MIRFLPSVFALSMLFLLVGCSAAPAPTHFVLTPDLQNDPSTSAYCGDVDPTPPVVFDMTPIAAAAEAAAAEYGAENVLVLFDVDNTLLAMRRLLGSDQWFTWREDILKDEDRMDAEFQCLLDAAQLLFEHGAMRATDPVAPALLRRMQQMGIHTAVLTSRGPVLQAATLRELAVAGFDFLRHSPPGWFADDDPRSIRYEFGLFMTSGLNKGEMAERLMKETDLNNIKKVVFVDDKPKHVCRVQNKMQDLKIDVSAFYYAAEDARVAPVVERDEATLNELREEWANFQSTLVCRSEQCVEASERCDPEWESYGKE